MSCTCTVCGCVFDANPRWRHSTGLCSDACRDEAQRAAKAKYKKTEKGKASNAKWVSSDRRKENEKGYRQQPRRKALNVFAQWLHLNRNPVAREKKRIRDEARRSVSGKFTVEEWTKKLEEYGGKCAHCGTTENITMDHIKPLALGGANTIDNIQPLCGTCNSRKGARYVG